MMPVLAARELSRTYPGEPPVLALRSATLQVDRGEKVAIVGPSGSGKSTLLNILGMLDRPTHGTYEFAGRDVTSLPARELDALRRTSIGFVFQAYHVLAHRTVRENLELKLAIQEMPRCERHDAVTEALASVRLEDLADASTRNLSGGEKQRLAIARAMLGSPTVVFADEATGNLDEANAAITLSRLDALAARGIAIVIITHDAHAASWADRRYRLDGGVLAGTG